MLRRAIAQDIGAIGALEARCHPHPWSADAFARELVNPASQVWVAGEIEAYVVVWRVLDELQIQNVTTAPQARRQGHARRLLEHVLAQPGLRDATLELRAGNEAALRLYESLGFVVCGRRPRYYSTGEDAVLMRKELEKS